MTWRGDREGNDYVDVEEWVVPNPSIFNITLELVQIIYFIKYYNSNNALQTATRSNYHVMGMAGRTLFSSRSGFNWTVVFQRDDGIKIKFVSGFGDVAPNVPETIRHALLMFVSDYYVIDRRNLS